MLKNDELMGERFVAFIDILGFKEVIKGIEERNSKDDLIFMKIRSILNFMDEETYEPNYATDLPVYEKTKDGLVERELEDPRLTYISDCIIISAQPNMDGFKGLSKKIHKITADLASDGVFCRGAITKGKLFHKERVIFGSAYIRAFKLEEEFAVFPRIIIDPEIINFFSLKEGQMPLGPAFYGLDIDGYYYQRYWTWFLYPPHCGAYDTYLYRVRGHIDENLEKFRETPCILEKYQWLDREFNSLICWWQELGLIDLTEHDKALMRE